MRQSSAQIINNNTLTLNVDDYPGGIAIWGALPALYDTTNQGFDRGVHVHARVKPVSKKAIDATYANVEVIWHNRSFWITEDVAVNFSLASIFNHKIISLDCDRCQQPMTSSKLFSLVPHHEHLCNTCGHNNITPDACVINPVIALKQSLNDFDVKRNAVLPNRRIEIDTNKYSGGVQIWGSNPSIIWTAQRLEESAIHVHAYRGTKRIVDNTYSEVIVDGHKLDIEMIRVLQIQLSFDNSITQPTTIKCPACKQTQFDRGIYAVLPQSSRICQNCQSFFTTKHPSISNPAISQLKLDK